MAESDPTPTVVDPEVVTDPAPVVVDPMADFRKEWKESTDKMLEKVGALESRLNAATQPRTVEGPTDANPLAGLNEADARAKLNELWFNDPSRAMDVAFNIKAGPVVAETRTAQAEIAKRAAASHPVYGPLLSDPVIAKEFDDAWARLPLESRIYERSAVETAAYAIGKHLDIVTKRAGDEAVAEASKRAPSGHSHAPSASQAAPKAVPVELTAEERDVARKLGIDEKEYAAYKTA